MGKRQQSYGGYSYVDFKLNKNWSTGFLFDYAPIVDNPSQRTLSYSPYVTWNISEFNRLRFQYSYLNNNFSADKADEWQSIFSPMDDCDRCSYPRVPHPLELYRKEYVYEDEIVESKNWKMFFMSLAFVWLQTGLVFAQQIRVVATWPALADITRQIGKELVNVDSLATGVEDPHGVPMKPSFVPRLNRADVLILIGLDDEHSWLPALLEVANNPKILLGRPGYIDCSVGVSVLEAPYARRPVRRRSSSQGKSSLPFGSGKSENRRSEYRHRSLA